MNLLEDARNVRTEATPGSTEWRAADLLVHTLETHRAAAEGCSGEDEGFRCSGDAACPSCKGVGSRLVRETNNYGLSKWIAACEWCAGSGRCPECESA